MDTEAAVPPIHAIHVTDWRPKGVQKRLSMTSRNFVGLLEDGCSVLKYPLFKTEEAMDALYGEAARFEALGCHEHLIIFKGVQENGLVFEYCEKGTLQEVIRTHQLEAATKFDIAKQVVRGLIHLHDHNFIHCDLNVDNVLVTSSMTAKIADIQGQLYNPDGTIKIPGLSGENVKSRHPHVGEDEFTTRTDIFALGTLLYHLWHGHPPFPDLSEYRDEEIIQEKYRAGEMPVDSGENAHWMDKIVGRCWNSSYSQAIEVLGDLDEHT